MELTDINKNLPGGENMGGVTKVYFGYQEDVATWPTKPLNPLTMEASAILTGSLTMKTGKRMFDIYITDDTGEFNIESVGEVDGKSFVEHLTFFHPGMQQTIISFMNAVKNANMIFVVQDADGNMFLMGDASRAAVYQGSPDGNGTGKSTSDRKGMSAEFTYKTANVYVYKGTVPLTIAVGI